MKTKLSQYVDMASRASKMKKPRKSRFNRSDEKQLNQKVLASDYPPLDLYFNAMRDRYDR